MKKETVYTGNKRIAKNTIIVYLELFITMAVNLITARLVLQALGASDYGLYNVVGGVIAMFTFIANSMSRTTIRFLNFEMGKPDGNVNCIFNQSNVLHLSIASLIFVLLETIGIYHILNYLKVDPSKEADAMFVYQVSTVVTCIGIANVPYKSIFIAHERFLAVALVDIAHVIVKFGLIVLLFYYQGNALRLYAIIMSGTALLNFAIYYLWGSRNWPKIVKWKFVKDWRSYKDQFFFSNWNLLKTGSMVARNQGAAILINWFFGTTVNAAYAIAYTVQQQIIHFVGKFDSAVAPQMTQNLGAGNIDRAVYLASVTCRMCFLLMEIAFFTLYVELEYILKFWLGGNIPEGTVTFCQYTLFIAVVSSTSGGLVQLINGFGKLKWFMIQMGLWYSLSLVVSYILFSWGYPAYVIVIMFVLSDIIYRIVELVLLKKLFSIDILRFIKDAYGRPIIIFVLIFAFVRLYQALDFCQSLSHIGGMILILFITSAFAMYVGLKRVERARLFSIVIKKMCK